MAKSKSNQFKEKKQSKNYIGMRFGRLLVIKDADSYISPKGCKVRRVECLCDCGDIKVIQIPALRNGATRSCGCLHSEITSKIFKKHGLIKHPLYRVWAQMKSRCNNPNDKGYKNYGADGISVCDEWSPHVATFIKWAKKNGWKKGLVLDRKDVHDDYCPDNCRFVDYGLSGRNKKLLVSNNTSGFRGVSFSKRYKRWVAWIMKDGRRFYLGLHDKPVDAARAYDAKARFLNAEHPLNFPEVS